MTTKLKGQASITREVVANDGTVYIICLREDGVYMREKRHRGEFGPLSYGYVYLQLGKQAAIERIQDSKKPAGRKSVSRGLLSIPTTLE